LGLAQLERKDEIMDKRKTNASVLFKGLEKYKHLIQLPKCQEHIEHTYMMFPILIKKEPKLQRRELITFLESHNIETRPMLPLLNQPVYKKIFGELEEKYPIASYINQHGFYIGCHHGLTKEDLDYVISVFDEYFQYRKELA